MSDQELLTEIDEGVARITFNRPHARNALTAGMLVTMHDFLKEVDRDPDVRCVLMSGAGDHFMAGGDIAGFDAALAAPADVRRRDFEERARGGIALFTVLERLTKPVVAKVRGAVAGASIGWVAAADFAIASDTALFAFAHIHLGTSPDGGVTWHLPRIVGLRRAKELVMLGERLTAAQALALDLVNRVVPDAELDRETDKLVARFATGPSHAYGWTRRLLNVAADNGQVRQMELEAEAFGDCAATTDFVEGVTAFTGKRRATFTGR